MHRLSCSTAVPHAVHAVTSCCPNTATHATQVRHHLHPSRSTHHKLVIQAAGMGSGGRRSLLPARQILVTLPCTGQSAACCAAAGCAQARGRRFRGSAGGGGGCGGQRWRRRQRAVAVEAEGRDLAGAGQCSIGWAQRHCGAVAGVDSLQQLVCRLQLRGHSGDGGRRGGLQHAAYALHWVAQGLQRRGMPARWRRECGRRI